jgi:Tol biopolymer transport system component
VAVFVSWNPNINTTPPYQFAFDDGKVVWIASVTGGLLRSLSGANNASYLQKMPSWGPNGKIAFVRGTVNAPNVSPGVMGFGGTSDILLVDENGGTPTPLAGASGNGMLNYYPAYSPDGRWIAFTTSASGTSYVATDARLRLADAGSSGFVSNLPNANGTTGGSFPTWSVDGTILSFSSPAARGGSGDWDIWYAPFTSSTGTDGPASNLSAANTIYFDHVARWSP